MRIDFHKYSGSGNDFVIIDNRDGAVNAPDNMLIKKLCDRRFGVGADGVILLNGAEGYDFEMNYYNADGHPGSMCGNGGRCISAFAQSLGIVHGSARFLAYDGEHRSIIQPQQGNKTLVKLSMADISGVEQGEGFYFLDTGSPHYVAYVKDVWNFDVFGEGKKVRNNQRFRESGTNVDFIEYKDDVLHVRTFERGVEDETLCCGTGVTASAIVAALHGDLKDGFCPVKAAGGELKVYFERKGSSFNNIHFEGMVEHVFNGSIEL